jgi:hypothetical protein
MSTADEFEAMTATDCCAACNEADGCIIGGMNCCLHPRKSGLQAIHRTMPAVLAKYERANKALKLRDALAKLEHGSALLTDMAAGLLPSAVSK